jgi:ribose/xylose/arabinose/galactoside ABC-type transport system permease subunit
MSVEPAPMRVRAARRLERLPAHLSGTGGLALFLALLIAVAAALQPSFFSVDNFRNILIQSAPLGFVVIGQTLVILVRGLDLSVASLMATVAVLATGFDSRTDAAIPVIMLAGLALGAVTGLVNGVLVAKRGISPFLATLAVMIVLQGARFAYTRGAPSGSLPPGFATLAGGKVLGVPVSLIVLVITAAAVAVLLSRTVLGRRLRLIGDNPHAAALAGIPVDRSTILAYVLCSLLATLGAFFLIGYVGIVDNWTGRGLDLDSIAAAVMGGASLKGGQGSVLGSLLGALVLVMIYNIVLLVGLSVEFQLIVKGAIIVVAAAFYLRRA